MTDEEISEGNKLIAKFMGYQILNKKYETQYVCSSNESAWGVTEGEIVCDSQGREVDDEDQEPYFYLEHLPFNSSWDWLMPVIDKIEDIDMSDYHYKWTDIDGSIRCNFRHFEFDMNRKSNGYSSCIWMELDLDPIEVVAGHYEKEYTTRIESAWNTVVEFIKYYNQQITYEL